eukprot:scaffold329732_cov52-Tisochrysis_lutea.AAC.1
MLYRHALEASVSGWPASSKIGRSSSTFAKAMPLCKCKNAWTTVHLNKIVAGATVAPASPGLVL